MVTAEAPSGKSTGLRLTETGFSTASRLAGAYCLADPEVRALYRRLVKLDAETDDARGTAEWKFNAAIGPEWATANTKEGKAGWMGVEWKMLPLLVNGHATVNSDIEGRAFYRPGAPLPARLPKAPAINAEDSLMDLWNEEARTFRAYLAKTAGLEPVSEIVIPCSCSWMPRRLAPATAACNVPTPKETR